MMTDSDPRDGESSDGYIFSERLRERLSEESLLSGYIRRYPDIGK
jgi:hypothetical protein